MNKSSFFYRSLRNAYYTFWKQNPHIYRLLLPLKMLETDAGSSRRTGIRLEPQRIKTVHTASGLARGGASGKSGTASIEVCGGDWDQQGIPLKETRIHEWVRMYLHSPGLNAAELENLWSKDYEKPTALDNALVEETGGLRRLADMIAATEAQAGVGESFPEISICVGRRGQLLCRASASSVIALCIAQLAGKPQISGSVVVRHKSWHRIRKRFFVLASSAFSEGHGALYQQLWHPDLMDVPHLHELDARVQFVEAAAKEGRTGRALDIGANLGFFCHRLEDLGFQCHAVENNAILVDHMRLLRFIEEKSFTVTCGNILGRGMAEVCSREYDLVLAFAIFHHFLKRKQTYQGLKRLLSRLRMERMILQTHNPEESQMHGAYKNFGPENFADHILEMSCLTKRQLMGKSPEGRHIFLLRR
jgi:hypothetical protein